MLNSHSLFVFPLATLAVVQFGHAQKPSSDYRAQLLAQHNQTRAEHELPPLKHNHLLAKAARAHADHMAKTGKLGHEGIGDGTIVSRIDATGYPWASLAENIGWGPKQPPGMMKIWLESPPHRATLLGKYQEVGFARAVGGNGKVYWVACFGVPLH